MNIKKAKMILPTLIISWACVGEAYLT